MPPRKMPPKRTLETIDAESTSTTEVEVRTRAAAAGAREVPPFTIAYVMPIQPITIPGVKITPGQRIDPMLAEWAEWRIIVSGASVLLVAPPGWTKGVVNAAGLTDEFAPVAAAHGWNGADDVRQVFELPRSMLMIRYYIDARGGDIPDLEFAEAIRARVIAAPDDKTRAAWAELEAEAEAEAAEMRAEAARVAAPAARVVRTPTPTRRPTNGKGHGPEPLVVPVTRTRKKDEDEDVGQGDPGPEDDDF